MTSIGSNAFNGCTGLTSVTIGNGVTSIGSSGFEGCTGLTSVTIPNSVTTIGVYAFRGCTGLTSVTIPNSVTSIGHDAFYDCSRLTSITIPNSVTSIGDWAFDGTAWYNNQPDGLVYAGNVAYKYKGIMPDNTSVTIKEGTVGITPLAFSDCTGLTSVTIPNSVTSIGYGAFADCTGLRIVTIGSGVTSIGKEAFSGSTRLSSMTVEATNPPYYSSTKNMVSIYTIRLYVPAASVDAYKAADEWKKFTKIQAIPATGVNEATAEKSEVKKIIDRNGIIYIEKDGTRYFLNGGKAE